MEFGDKVGKRRSEPVHPEARPASLTPVRVDLRPERPLSLPTVWTRHAVDPLGLHLGNACDGRWGDMSTGKIPKREAWVCYAVLLPQRERERSWTGPADTGRGLMVSSRPVPGLFTWEPVKHGES